jgi:hypothetical protein
VCVCVGFVMCGCLDNVHSLNLFGYPDRFFRTFSSVVRQMPGYNSQRLGTANTLPNCYLCCFFVIRVVLLLIVMFCVLFICKCVLLPGVNPIAVGKYIYIISKRCQNGLILGTIRITTSFDEGQNLFHVRGCETGQIEVRYGSVIAACLGWRFTLSSISGYPS